MSEDTTQRRKRAPAMSVEDRREAIVAATTPLLLQHGANVTTSQIAQAAGIAEGTVFRAFKDKQELIATCVRSVLAVDAELAVLAEARQVEQLPDRLSWAISAVSGYLDRTWRLMGVLRESGYDPHRKGSEHKGPPVEMRLLSARIAELFTPDAHRMRVPAELAARLLMGLVFTNRMQGEGFGETSADTDQLVELYLHGVLRGDQ
ncbi:TetR/AcrR family transcriptional regulator [Actinosynnema sp. NPDC047251]|uniref:HTH tetR-type domain-containing protein n=1 Tax=Saccharothrix espanaensis (strain ATCC 51144 / DSM 44229 / JCM 9112 / NBRC 15066 / NRRL 15764) TaxID=1179773 RepID=K0JPG2_SACES|nr:TetR/AcrR family transcriptional regulator [Saccharothrix espanaensis]CCH28645.1 hypothetical protein BN6_13190 [Saccharothrix espanaensis DSM 44229]